MSEPVNPAAPDSSPAEIAERTPPTPPEAVVAAAAAEPAAEAVATAVAESAPPALAKPARPKRQRAAGGEKAATGDPSAARPKRRPRPARPASRAEEFVKPTAEDLAGIVSETVRAAVEAELPVGGKIIGWNQGGFHAVVDGISAFCPRSSMELGAPHEPAHYLDQEYLFRVLRVEEKGKRLVLSRTAVLREEKRHQVEEARKQVQLGNVVRGKVISILDFGAFLDLGGFEGMVHVSELRRTRVGHPNEVLTLGQEVEAKVVKLPQKRHERISLSLRALEPDPWAGVAEKWPAGSKFSGKIVRKSEFGWFVELAPAVEGLLHPSQLPPGMKPEDPRLADGATLEGWVREVEPARGRISLSLRETPAGNPWSGVEKRFAEGDLVTGTIERLAPFGVFVTLEPGLTGLLPTAEMGLPRGASVGKAYPLGREVKLKVAEVDPRKRRISLTREDKTLEGSRADYKAYQQKARRDASLGALAAALERLKS